MPEVTQCSMQKRITKRTDSGYSVELDFAAGITAKSPCHSAITVDTSGNIVCDASSRVEVNAISLTARCKKINIRGGLVLFSSCGPMNVSTRLLRCKSIAVAIESKTIDVESSSYDFAN